MALLALLPDRAGRIGALELYSQQAVYISICEPIAMLKILCYYAVFTPLSTIGGNYLTETVGWPGLLVTILNMACNFILEFLYDRFFVFGKTIDTNKRAQAKREI